MNRKEAVEIVLKSYTSLLSRAIFSQALDDPGLLAEYLESYYQLRRILEEPAPVELPIQAPPGAKPQDFVPVPPPVPSRGTAAAKFKRDVRDRIEDLRERGVPLQRIIDASGGTVRMSELLDVLQAAKVEYAVYKRLDDALKHIPET